MMEAKKRPSRKHFVGAALVIVILVIAAGFVLPIFSRSRERSDCAHVCRWNIRELLRAEKAYAADHQGKFSEKLSELYPAYVDSLKVFRCPSATGPEITRKEDIDSLTSYVLRKGLTTTSPGDEVLIYEIRRHTAGEGHVALIDGTVRRLSRSDIERIAEKDQGR